MPVKANEIASYTGNAVLGGNEAGTGTGSVYDFSGADRAVNQLAYLNMQKNHEIWKQKLADRDAAMQLIANGQLNTGEVLPEDRDKVRGLIDDAKSMWMQHHGDLKSDPDVWIKFNGQLSKITEATTYGQSRLVDYKKGMADAAKELNPVIKQRMIDHYNAEKAKPLNEPFLPYQQTMNWDNGIVAQKIPSVQKTLSVSADGITKTVQNQQDLEAGYRMYTGAYVNGDKQMTALNVDEFLKAFYGQDGMMQPAGVNYHIKNVNDTLDKIAVERGYDITKPHTMPVYLRHINGVLVNGQVHSDAAKWDDWYKIQLADQYAKGEITTVTDKDAALVLKAKSDMQLNRAKMGTESSKQNLNNARANKLNRDEQEHQAQNGADITTVYHGIVDAIRPGAGMITNGKNKTSIDIVHTDELPAGFKYINGMGIGANGKASAQSLKPFKDQAGRPYWIAEYVDIANGNKVDVSQKGNADLAEGYKQTREAMAQQDPAGAQHYTYDDFIKRLIKMNKIGLRLKGEGSAANLYSLSQSIKGINNQVSSGKEENVFSTAETGDDD